VVVISSDSMEKFRFKDAMHGSSMHWMSVNWGRKNR
jgi:hypothetical protein